LISTITFSFGYLQYIYSFRLVLREKKAPFPVWMHTLYLAHDTTAAIVFFLLARQHDWFWFFTLTAIALTIWTLFELFNLLRVFMADEAMFKWFALTNVVMAVGPGL
jgi:hypothetical protein